jgi:enolase
MAAGIASVHGREVLDSRGAPTVEAEVELVSGVRAVASVPAGASRGSHEAVELRDGDRRRYRGLGVRSAVANVNEEIAPALAGCDALDQAAIDGRLLELDGTEGKTRLGANATLAVSLAVARAAAAARGVSLWRSLLDGRSPVLPLPMVNVISGGLHAGRNVDVQDFLAVPVGASSFSEALELVAALRASTGALLEARGHSTLKADEGGFGPALGANVDALELLCQAAEKAGLEPGGDVAFAIDVAASQLVDAPSGRYRLEADGRLLGGSELVDLVEAWSASFPLVSVEDALAEDDWAGWAELTRRLGSRLQLLGDDLFVTSVARLERGIASGVANAILVKMNQVGTLTETLAVVERAAAAGYAPVISARSGETEDSFLADLAVATGAGQVKIGSLAQSDRLAKYNQLLRIEEELGDDAVFAGRAALKPGAHAAPRRAAP